MKMKWRGGEVLKCQEANYRQPQIECGIGSVLFRLTPALSLTEQHILRLSTEYSSLLLRYHAVIPKNYSRPSRDPFHAKRAVILYFEASCRQLPHARHYSRNSFIIKQRSQDRFDASTNNRQGFL